MARPDVHVEKIIRGATVMYDITAIASAPFVASWVATRFGLGYVALYLIAAPAVSYVVSLLTDWLEDLCTAQAHRPDTRV